MTLSIKHPSSSFRTFQTYSWFYPVGIAILVPSLCVFSYLTSLHLNQLEPFFPFVSDAGASLPQAPYFSMSLDLVALLVCLTAISRHRQLRYLISLNFVQVNHADPSAEARLHKLNRASFLLSFFAALSLLAVGNFRTTESNRVHTFAAFAMFTLTLLYFALQCRLSRILYVRFGVESSPTSMMLVTGLGVIAYLVCFTGSTVSMAQFGEERFFTDTEGRMRWGPEDAGFVAHVLGTIAEWIAINSIPLMYLCLCRRMKRFERTSQV